MNRALISAFLRAFLGSFGGIIIAASQAQAYIPPSLFLVERIVQPRAKLEAIRLKTTVAARDGDEALPHSFTEVTLFDFSRGVAQVRALDAMGVELYAKEARLGSDVTAVTELLVGRAADQVTQSLLRAHLPIRTAEALQTMKDESERRAAEIQSLKRWEGRFFWVIGSMQKDPASSELWVEKDSFLPMRWLSSSGETQFDQYRFVQGVPYPGELRVIRGGKVVLQSTLVEMEINPKRDVKKETKPGMKVGATSGFTPAMESAGGSLRELIEFYFAQVR